MSSLSVSPIWLVGDVAIKCIDCATEWCVARDRPSWEVVPFEPVAWSDHQLAWAPFGKRPPLTLVVKPSDWPRNCPKNL